MSSENNNGSKNKILVTSALPYVNNVPHLGNIIGCVLSADVYARFARNMGYDTLFVCGTDEHGTTSESKAMEEGVAPKEICDKYYKIHKKIYEWFKCSFDAFGRTSDKANHETAQDIFLKLKDNGYILEDEIEQMYSEKSKMFLADRFVEGKCPKCGFEKARGDQCDNCGTMLNPTDLIDPVSKVDGTKPVIKKVKHLFMDLPKIAPELKNWIDSRNKNWSENARKMTSAWLRDGLKPRCITRDLKWGVKVPMEGYTDKVFYSWFDAPIGYIGIAKAAFDDWNEWWKDDENVRLIQFMGKDNIPFHTIMFPSFLIGAKDDYTLLYNISSTEYLNYETGKFSKSNNTGVFGDDAMNTGIPVDVWRYYLLANRPETSDTEFSWKDFQERNNSELLANLGNFVNRTLTFSSKNFDLGVPESGLDAKGREFMDKIEKEIRIYENMMEKIQLRDGIKQVMHISRLGNQFFQEQEPWKMVKENKEVCAASIYACCELVRKLAIIVEPYLPETSKEIFSQLGMDGQNMDSILKMIGPGHKFGSVKPIFRKLEDSEIKSFQDKFSGKREEKQEDHSDLSLPNLKVAEILSVEDHPDADKLFVMQINLGAEKRQLVAGLRAYYSKEELLGKHIVVVSNLKPAKLRGKESQGMLLAADKKDIVKVLEAPQSEPGTQVYFEGVTPSEKQITIDDFFTIKIKIKDKKAQAEGKFLKTDSEFVSVDIADGAKVR
ncbi:MAG: methionine--tRNA ligase [Candidatus Woesearchaeota archaeon]